MIKRKLYLVSFDCLFDLDKPYLIGPFKSYEKEISGYQGMRFNQFFADASLMSENIIIQHSDIFHKISAIC